MLVSLVFQLHRPLHISFDCDEIIEFNFLISGCERVDRIREFLPPHPIGTSLRPPLHHIGILSSGDTPTRPSKPTQPTLPCKPTTSVSNNNNVNPEQNRQTETIKSVSLGSRPTGEQKIKLLLFDRQIDEWLFTIDSKSRRRKGCLRPCLPIVKKLSLH
jgi:hypothetical protein